jgi:hypothetical protein
VSRAYVHLLRTRRGPSDISCHGLRSSHHSVQSDLEPGEYGSFLRSWVRSLRARNLSPKTVKTYREAAEGPGAYVARTDGPRDLGAILRVR